MKSGIKHFTEWLIAIVILIVLGFVSSFFVGRGIEDSFAQFFNPNPGVILLGLETQAAIDIFSGNIPHEIGIDFKTISMLISVIFLLMLGPWLLYTGYKHFEQKDLNNKPWYWFMGACLSLVSLSIIPILAISYTVFQNTQEIAQENRVKDLMRAELMEVGFATAEYGIVEDGYNDTFTIQELEMDDLKYEYSIESISSDTSLIILTENPEYEEISVRAEITPFSPKSLNMRN